ARAAGGEAEGVLERRARDAERVEEVLGRGVAGPGDAVVGAEGLVAVPEGGAEHVPEAVARRPLRHLVEVVVGRPPVVVADEEAGVDLLPQAVEEAAVAGQPRGVRRAPELLDDGRERGLALLVEGTEDGREGIRLAP